MEIRISITKGSKEELVIYIYFDYRGLVSVKI